MRGREAQPHSLCTLSALSEPLSRPMHQRTVLSSVIWALRACVLLGFCSSTGAADFHTASIRGHKVLLPIPSGMTPYSVDRAITRSEVVIPDANELIALFFPTGSIEYDERSYLVVQASRQDATPSAEQLAKVADDMVAAGQLQAGILERAKAAFEKRAPQLRTKLGDNTAKIVPLGLVVRGHLMRSDNVQAVNATATFSVTVQGAEHVMSRPTHLAIARVRPDKIVYAAFYGEIDDPPDSKRYESMFSSWLIDFDKRNNEIK